MKYSNLFLALKATSQCIMLSDVRGSDNIVSFVNPAFTVMTGYGLEEAVGRNPSFLQGPETDRQVVAEIGEAIARGMPIRRELLNYRKNGEPFWNDLSIDPIRDEDGTLVGFIGVQYDSSDKRAAVNDRNEVEARLSAIVSNLPGYVFQRRLKHDGTLELAYASSALGLMLGLAEGVMPTWSDVFSHLHPDDRGDFDQRMSRSASNMSLLHMEFRLVCHDRRERWFRTDSVPRRLANGDTIWDGVALEITNEKVIESQLAHFAYHDALTGLSNRQFFKNSLLKAITAVSPAEDRIAAFSIDLARFQDINDTLGQSAGDLVLRAVGQRLMEFAQAHAGTAARLGGDEFGLLLTRIPPDASISELAESVGRTLARATAIDGREVTVEAYIGGTVFPFERAAGATAVVDASAELMKQADLALQAARQDGPGVFRLYSPEFDDRVRNRVELRRSLDRAVAEEQFVLHYHPLVDLASGRTVGAEALVRWNHPELGMQRPDLFIPLAETSGLIIPLGAWVMKNAMRQSQNWKRQGIETPRIAINVSGVQLQKSGLIATVERALGDTGADPRDFELELTESTLIEASPVTLDTLNALTHMGFHLTIDDFGTGHAAFRYLRDFPIGKIKIDQSFVRQLVIDSSDAAIIRAMIALSRSLRLDVVAEGIETAAQRDFLRDEGCKTGQGYLFSLPMTAEDFGWMLERRVTLPMAAE